MAFKECSVEIKTPFLIFAIVNQIIFLNLNKNPKDKSVIIIISFVIKIIGKKKYEF